LIFVKNSITVSDFETILTASGLNPPITNIFGCHKLNPTRGLLIEVPFRATQS
jgi:hypothetical protein